MERISKRETEKMSDIGFKMMTFTFKVIDFIIPYINKRINKFNIQEGMTIIDYGCGPGRYTIPFSKKVGQNGKIYALDIHPMALEMVHQKAVRLNIKNIETFLVKGIDEGKYESGLHEKIGDIVCALDMFFIIKNPVDFLKEIYRIMKDNGILIIDDGHQSRKKTKEKLSQFDKLYIIEETKDHIKLKKK